MEYSITAAKLKQTIHSSIHERIRAVILNQAGGHPGVPQDPLKGDPLKGDAGSIRR